MEFLFSWASPDGVSLPGACSYNPLPACNYDVATSKNASRIIYNADFTMLKEHTFTGCRTYTPPMDMTYGHDPCPGARPTQIFWSISSLLNINKLTIFS